MDEEIRLIRRIQLKGDRAAADLLIRKYYDEIYRYVYRQTSDKHMAMDLTQGIFISLLQSIRNYDMKQAGFRTWLYKIATYKTIDCLRSRTTERKHVVGLSEADLPDEADFMRSIEMRALTAGLRSYINTLPTEEQQIFRLKFFGDYTFLQISDSLSLPESTVKSKYYRLLKVLREEFKDE